MASSTAAQQPNEWRQRLERLEEENKYLRRLANLDGLTQIANRRLFEEHLAQQWSQLATLQAPLTILMIDVDCFKQYNDLYGHLAGDRCLKQVAQVIKRCARRTSDLVARYGGEEFVVSLPLTDTTAAQLIATIIQQKLSALGIQHQDSPAASGLVSVSIGVASGIPQTHCAPSELIKAADAALYQAKQLGRDRIQVGHCPQLTPDSH